ncbi:hypothetical protein D3C71_545750 [compost metagenome]
MSSHLKYQKLPWGGYVVRNEHVWGRVQMEHFGMGYNHPETPREYPCVVWFKDGTELCQARLPKTLDAGLRRLGELAEENWRLYVKEPKPTPEQLERDRDFARDMESIYKLSRWAGVMMRDRYEKFWLRERKLKGLFYIELNVAAIEWDMRPEADENGLIRVWMRELKDVAPTYKGLSMWFGRGLATRMSGNRPVVSWEAIHCVGSLRPGGTTAKFYPELQYAKRSMLPLFQNICKLLKDVGIEFDESPKEDN